jgi:hypothetical protein
MPFAIIKTRFLRKLESNGPQVFVISLGVLVAVSVAFCLRHAVVLGLLVIPATAGMFALQMLIDEHTERKEERELAASRLKWEANAHQRAYAKAIFKAIQECPTDADDAHRQRAIQSAADEFRRTCDKPLPEFLGAQVDGHFVPASQS